MNYRNGLKRLEDARNELTKLKVDNEKLKKDEAYYQSDEYVEKAVLENLNMTKDTGTILVMDKKQTFTEKNVTEQLQTQENTQNEPNNVQLWLKAFNFD